MLGVSRCLSARIFSTNSPKAVCQKSCPSKHRLLIGQNSPQCCNHLRRSLCDDKQTSLSATAEDVTKVCLTKPLKDLPIVTYAKPSAQDDSTQVTVLSNGLRVASQRRFGQFCTVGVVIESGPRYEVAFPSGISHFLEKLAFGSTTAHKDRDEVLRVVERQGGICDAQGTRDTMIYAASAESRGAAEIIDLLGDVVLRPRLGCEELEMARMSIEFELKDVDMRPDQEALLMEMIHKAAYNKNTLGLPKLCPPESITQIDTPMLYTYLRAHYAPSKMVVAGVGVEHDLLVEAAQRSFVDEAAIWEDDPTLLGDRNLQADGSLAQYTGGVVKVEKDLSNMSLGPTPIPDLAHFVLGLESCSHKDEGDFIAFCVLNMLMGGGGSFSAGGPGKGMYSRLYTNVLNRYHWMYNATAYNHAYGDSGLFCIHASADPSTLGELVEIIVQEFARMTERIGTVELDRSKKQLQSMLLMNLEQRPVLFEDVARQVLSLGLRRNAQFYIDAIDKVSEADIHRVAHRMLRSRASVAALGNLRKLPRVEDIETGLVSSPSSASVASKRFSLFR